MTLKVAIIDLSDTMVSKQGEVAEGIPEMFDALREMGIKIVVSSNDPEVKVRRILSESGLAADFIAARDNVGTKGTNRYCPQIAAQFGCELCQMVYVGDNDATDFRSCVNSNVLYLSARWADPGAIYGIPAASPDSVRRFVARHLTEDPVWYWQLKREDSVGRPIDARSLVPKQNKDVDALKRDYKVLVNSVDYFRFLFRRVIASLYLDGRLAEYKFITFYPGHAGGQKGSRYTKPLDNASKIFRSRYAEDLLIRHAPAQKSSYLRHNGGQPLFTTQTNTLHINPVLESKLQGKRVLVLDDFCTDGNAFECSRNLLLQGGVSQVDCVSVARYGTNYIERIPRANLSWDPYKVQTLKESDFTSKLRTGTVNSKALEQHDRQLAVK